ncbi:NPL4-like protein 2 isoform X2 [Aristolochia californica]|uniref:NPL4-like protein 2 isoform X2 n=1 Tax=Aristolochia californica TaxID=171875 RepID=UPI0035E22896
MMIRVRSRDGLERVNVPNPHTTVGDLRTLIESQLRVPFSHQTLSRNQNLLLAKTPEQLRKLADMSDSAVSLSSVGISHGSIVYLSYEGERSVTGGSPVSPAGSFGKKMTMDDLIARQMRVSRQETPHCSSVSFDRDAANAFQLYVNDTLAFAIKRGGFMYGIVSADREVSVQFIYEPPQQGTESNLLLLRDPEEENLVEAIALGLGLRKAVELHAESGLQEWVTAVVKLEVNEDGGADAHFEAFQMSDICVKLLKEGWFETEGINDIEPKLSKMKKDVIVGGKDSREVDNDFFLVVVKILDHQGPLSCSFPIENRINPVTMRALKTHLDSAKSLSFVKRISNFHLLLLLAKFLDVNSDVPALAECVQAQSPVPEGYQLLIESLANTS